jgi:hypothetical protein
VTSANAQPRRNGLRWAVTASFAIAASFVLLAIISPAPGMETGEHANCSVSNPVGILWQTLGKRPEYDEWKVEFGETRAFPPATQCLLYGRNNSGSGNSFEANQYRLAVSRFYPDATSYIWLLLVILSPIILVLGFRGFRLARQ